MKRLKSCVAVLMSVMLLSSTQQISAFATEEPPVGNENAIVVETVDAANSASSVVVTEDDAANSASSVVVTEDDAANSASSVAVTEDDAANTASSVVVTEDDAANTASSVVVTEDDAASTTSSVDGLTTNELGLDTVTFDSTNLFGFGANEGTNNTVDYEVLYFNTGNMEDYVIPQENSDDDPWAYTFDDNGNFNIPINEVNPYFPYQIQFRSGDETWTEWFATPSSTVEVNGHVIGVEIYNNNYSSITLHVGGRDIIVYPEEKTFTNAPMLLMSKSLSLQPLVERSLSSVNLTGISPADLTMVSATAIFAGEDVSGSIIWNYVDDYEYYDDDDDEYTVSTVGDTFDLSRRTSSGGTTKWEMIVGEADQLASSNIRYRVSCSVSYSRRWLTPSVSVQGADGSKSALTVSSSYYEDDKKDSRELYISATVPSSNQNRYRDTYYVSLNNGGIFTELGNVSFYEGSFTNASEASSATDITSSIWNTDPSTAEGGYQLVGTGSSTIYSRVTMVTRDGNGTVTGCLPFQIRLNLSTPSTPATVAHGNLDYNSLYNVENDESVSDTTSSSGSNPKTVTYTLYKEYPASGTYKTRLSFRYQAVNETSSSRHNEMVASAYEGDYETPEAATAAGATDIKDQLFATSYRDGYSGVFEAGKTFSVFVNEEGTIQKYAITLKAVNGNRNRITLNTATAVKFTGLVDAEGNDISCYHVDAELDSYGDYCYRTIIVEPDVDLSKVAPTFVPSDGVRLYGVGSSTPIESGRDFRDFSNGQTQQYTAASEDGSFQTNYWLQIVQQREDVNLYINSFGDENSGYEKDENGVIRANREVILDSRTDKKHSILVSNMGSQPLRNVKAELSSDTLVIDEYWTLSGNHDLAAYSGIEKTTQYGELANLARIYIKAKDGVENGSDVSGTLTLSSNGNTIAVLTLTGTLGDPCIITKEVPDAVKYVHYGTMIMNNNKYRWNTVSYTLTGDLPAGLSLMPNGEIYGIPTETGEFTFRITMENSSRNFVRSSREYTLKVLDNTDENVDNATSVNYDVTQRVPDFNQAPDADYTFVSQGLYPEFLVKTYVTIDGERLTPGTDYSSESGSTRITIFRQTLARGEGTHTISVEFRNDNDEFNRAAQNYHITGTQSSDDSGDRSSDSSSSDSSSSSSSSDSSSGSSSSGSSSSDSSNSGSSSSSSSSSSNNSAAPITVAKVKGTVTFSKYTGSTDTPRGTVTVANASIQEREQGPLAQVSFDAGTPAGYTQATTFNMLVDGGINYNAKNGSLVLNINPSLVKAGRTFAIVGLDKNGQPHLFLDSDSSDNTITCNISLEGYAFSLIYSDNTNAAKNLSNSATTGVYVVQPRDTLSKIAKMFGTTVADLVEKNNIADPNKIYPNQTIKY